MYRRPGRLSIAPAVGDARMSDVPVNEAFVSAPPLSDARGRDRHLEVANLGHVPLLDEPECIAALDGFLSRLSWATPHERRACE